MLTIESLKNLYVKMGGSLSDTYPFAGGTVGEYTYIPYLVEACSQKYSAGGGGGGAEKFIVTLTQENDTWTADKTIAEIVAADKANQIVVAKYPTDITDIELPLSTALEIEGTSIASFTGVNGTGDHASIVTVGYFTDGSDANIDVTEQTVNTNAPLIVTLTAGATEGQLVGDKTYKEVYDAFMAGQNCIFNAPAMLGAFAVLAVGHETDYRINAYGDISASGAANDYITITVGG